MLFQVLTGGFESTGSMSGNAIFDVQETLIMFQNRVLCDSNKRLCLCHEKLYRLTRGFIFPASSSDKECGCTKLFMG
jgi:hypothetical protein